MSAGAEPREGLPVAGILLIVVGLSAAAFSGALMKMLAESMPVMQIVWFRFAGYFLLMVPVIAWRSRGRIWPVPRAGMQLVRGLAMMGATVAFIVGARSLAYADAIAILYAYPFLLTLVAPWALGERVGAVAWLGVAGGFLGVLVVVRPSFDGVGADALWVLLCAALVAAQMVINRKLGAVADPLVTSCYGAFVAMAATTLALPGLWQPVPGEAWAILAVLAVTAAGSQTAIVLAFSRAPASDLAPFTYAEIVAAVAIGLAVFGTLPDALGWAGIGLIVLSGILVARAMALRQTPRRVPKI